jgi:hypothetical protein
MRIVASVLAHGTKQKSKIQPFTRPTVVFSFRIGRVVAVAVSVLNNTRKGFSNGLEEYLDEEIDDGKKKRFMHTTIVRLAIPINKPWNKVQMPLGSYPYYSRRCRVRFGYALSQPRLWYWKCGHFRLFATCRSGTPCRGWDSGIRGSIGMSRCHFGNT